MTGSIQNRNMFYVYVIVDRFRKKHYVGSTSDLRRRVTEHLRGKVYWTKRLEKPELLYYEAYSTEENAREREKKLKQRGSAKMALMKRIELK